MRHRAAIGISEITDAEVVVVSEETGNISYVADGQITTMQSIAELRLKLENSYGK
ncbi:MAG: DNA integrity scanning protein DisA nucleotide-binding domain protein [Bacteroidales bacterium]|nr:DNA integrity scanning protein DisA nucleotide-binding domain protein [Bacteroidales bacterium]